MEIMSYNQISPLKYRTFCDVFPRKMPKSVKLSVTKIISHFAYYIALDISCKYQLFVSQAFSVKDKGRGNERKNRDFEDKRISGMGRERKNRELEAERQRKNVTRVGAES